MKAIMCLIYKKNKHVLNLNGPFTVDDQYPIE